MPRQITQRPATPSEQVICQRLLAEIPSTRRHVLRLLENMVVLWTTSLLGLVLVAYVLCWLLDKLLLIRIQMQSPIMLALLVLAVLACALFAIITSLVWGRKLRRQELAFAADLASSVVQQESYQIVALKRFQEPEHNGLIYFLLTDENKVLVLYDYESQQLGLQERDPLSSSLVPKTSLSLIRGINTGSCIDRQFSGNNLALNPPRELSLDPDDWPEDTQYCELDFANLEHLLSDH